MNYFRVIYNGLTETEVKRNGSDSDKYLVFTECVKDVVLPMEGIFYFPDANYEASLEAILSLVQDDGFMKISPTEWIPFFKIISVKSVPNSNNTNNTNNTKTVTQPFINNKKEYNQDGRDNRDNFKRKFKRNNPRDGTAKEVKKDVEVAEPVVVEEIEAKEETDFLFTSSVDLVDNLDPLMDANQDTFN